MSQINVNTITGKDGGSAVNFPHGITVTGVVTATQLNQNVTGNITASGIVTGGAFSGPLTGNVTGNVTSSGANTLGSLTVSNDATITGNLTVNGTTTTIDTAVTAVDSLAVDGAGTFGGSVTIGSTTTQYTHIKVNRSDSGYIFEGGQTGSFTSRIFADGSATFSTVSDSMGPLRRLGQTITTPNYTLIASDAGKHVRVDSGATITIPDNVFTSGDMITIVANSSNDVPIVQGSGLNLYNASDGTTGNKTLKARTVCTILVAEGGSGAKAYIAGGGLS